MPGMSAQSLDCHLGSLAFDLPDCQASSCTQSGSTSMQHHAWRMAMHDEKAEL